MGVEKEKMKLVRNTVLFVAAVVFVLVGFSGTLQKESFQNSHRLSMEE